MKMCLTEYDEGDEEDIDSESGGSRRRYEEEDNGGSHRHREEEEEEERDPNLDMLRYACEDENPCEHICTMIQYRSEPEARIECSCRQGFYLNEEDGLSCIGMLSLLHHVTLYS